MAHERGNLVQVSVRRSDGARTILASKPGASSLTGMHWQVAASYSAQFEYVPRFRRHLAMRAARIGKQFLMLRIGAALSKCAAPIWRNISSAADSSASIRPWKKCCCSSGSTGTWFSAPVHVQVAHQIRIALRRHLDELVAGRAPPSGGRTCNSRVSRRRSRQRTDVRPRPAPRRPDAAPAARRAGAGSAARARPSPDRAPPGVRAPRAATRDFSSSRSASSQHRSSSSPGAPG